MSQSVLQPRAGIGPSAEASAVRSSLRALALGLALVAFSPRAFGQPPPSDPPAQDHAESVMLVGISPDGSVELSVRLARFPGRGEGSLWVSVAAWGRVLAMNDDGLELPDAGATPVHDAQVQFEVAGAAGARFSSENRQGASMRGTLVGWAKTHEALHPEPGVGTLPVTFEATFEASHEGIRVRPGRLEVFGRVRAQITTPDGTFDLDVPGKWHEQTGSRPRFAGTFTYLAAQNETTALLARGRGPQDWGYLKEGDDVTLVRTFEIDPLGSDVRHFRLVLEDGREVEGRATVLRQGSVAIEGQRRPGATVVVESEVGRLVGHLNDWDPEPLGRER